MIKLFREPKKNVYVDTVMTVHEMAVRARIERLREDISAAQSELDSEMKACKHEVKYDVAGLPYDVRYCAICGKLLETI